MVPPEDLAGIHLLRRSPALKLEPFIDQSHRFLGTPPAAPLSDWLELTPDEVEALNGIVHRAAEARIAWEIEHLRSERVEPGHYRIKWREPGHELTAVFQRELAERFGETLARSIWIRGSLGRFAEPVPRWESRGVEEIEIRITSGLSGIPAVEANSLSAEEMNIRLTQPGSRFVVRLSNGDWNNVQVVTPVVGEIPISPRLRHLFQLKTDSAEVHELVAAAEEQTTPVATRASEGMVFSPFNGKVVDVRGIPPGTLVADPTLPPEEKAYFRTPLEE